VSLGCAATMVLTSFKEVFGDEVELGRRRL
jgi:hypothetical protein